MAGLLDLISNSLEMKEQRQQQKKDNALSNLRVNLYAWMNPSSPEEQEDAKKNIDYWAAELVGPGYKDHQEGIKSTLHGVGNAILGAFGMQLPQGALPQTPGGLQPGARPSPSPPGGYPTPPGGTVPAQGAMATPQYRQAMPPPVPAGQTPDQPGGVNYGWNQTAPSRLAAGGPTSASPTSLSGVPTSKLPGAPRLMPITQDTMTQGRLADLEARGVLAGRPGEDAYNNVMAIEQDRTLTKPQKVQAIEQYFLGQPRAASTAEKEIYYAFPATQNQPAQTKIFTERGGLLYDQYGRPVSYTDIEKQGGIRVDKPTAAGTGGELGMLQKAYEIKDDPNASKSAKAGADQYIASHKGAAASEEAPPSYTAGTPSVANPNMNPGLEAAAAQYMTTNRMPPLGFSRTDLRKRIVERAGEMMVNLGLEPTDLQAVQALTQADRKAFERITLMDASINQLEGTLSRNMQLAKTLSDAYQRSDYQFINRVTNAFKTGTGDDEALNLAAQLHAVSQEWAKILEGGAMSAAGVHIDSAQAAGNLITNAMSKGQLTSLFDNVISKDADNRSQAIGSEKNRLLKELRDPTAGIKGAGGGPPPGGRGGGTVRLRAPDGQEWDAPADQVDYYVKKGATVVK